MYSTYLSKTTENIQPLIVPGLRRIFEMVLAVTFLWFLWFCVVLSVAPGADFPKKPAGREETASPPAVEEKRQPVVSSSILSHVPATRTIPPVNAPTNNPTPQRPPPDRTEDEDNEYDSDDASKIDYCS